MPSLDELQAAWPTVLGRLTNKARARFNAGSFVGTAGDVAEFALPNAIHRDRCEELRADVEAALNEHFGRPVPLRLVVGGAADPSQGPLRSAGAAPSGGGSEAASAADDCHDEQIADIGDVAELADADVASSSIDRITELFPGAEVVEE